MVNYAHREMGIAAPSDRPFAPYLSPMLHESPWLPDDNDRRAAREKWACYAKNAKRRSMPRELAIRTFLVPFTLRDMRRFMSRFVMIWWPCLPALSLSLSLSPSLPLSLIFDGVTPFDYRFRRDCSVISPTCGRQASGRARKRSAVSADFVAILATENPQLKEQTRKEVALSSDPDAESKTVGDFSAGIVDAWSFPTSGRGRGRGRGRGSASGHKGGQGQLRQRSRSPPHGAQGYQANLFQANQFPGGHGYRPQLQANFHHQGLGPYQASPKNYGPRSQANVHLRPNGLGQGQARQHCQGSHLPPLGAPHHPLIFEHKYPASFEHLYHYGCGYFLTHQS